VSEDGAATGRASPARRDVPLLFATRIARLFAYGFLSVVLVLYLGALGFDGPRTGLLLTATLLGDAAITLWITSRADRVGRRRMLLLGAVLMAAGGVVFLATRNPWLLVLAAIVGVISPSGNEIGPFLAIEQAALSEVTVDRERTRLFAWYNVAGSGATALGALAGGWLTSLLQHRGLAELDSYRLLLAIYAFLGFAIGVLFAFLSPAVEVKSAEVAGVRRWFGLHRSRGIVARLSALFGLDAFAGGFILQSVVAYWFHARFGATPATLGTLFFAANVLAAISALVASSLAARIGLVQTMVFTHLPSNVLLMTVPWMPSLPLAIAMYLIRSSISQMDVPTRQSYTVAVVAPDERAAASGVTAIARSIGAAAAPWVGGAFLLTGVGAPFYIAGSLKIVYDLLLFRSFKGLKPPEEAGAKISA
jgi:MFS family permease